MLLLATLIGHFEQFNLRMRLFYPLHGAIMPSKWSDLSDYLLKYPDGQRDEILAKIQSNEVMMDQNEGKLTKSQSNEVHGPPKSQNSTIWGQIGQKSIKRGAVRYCLQKPDYRHFYDNLTIFVTISPFSLRLSPILTNLRISLLKSRLSPISETISSFRWQTARITPNLLRLASKMSNWRKRKGHPISGP